MSVAAYSQDAAELRLGRRLTPGELLIDVEQIDRLLEQAKLDLAAEIEKAKAKAIRAYLETGEWPHIEPSKGMLAVLAQLHADGQVVAIEEIRRHGYEPELPDPGPAGPELFAEGAAAERRIRKAAMRFVERARVALGRLLPSISARVVEHAAELDLNSAPIRAIAEEMERQVPGSLDVAGRLVSSSLYAGMGGIYEANKDLFPGFEYTAVMDKTTCAVCGGLDGTKFDSWEEGETLLPGGGPNPDCYGDGRCRCRLVPTALPRRYATLEEKIAAEGLDADPEMNAQARRVLGDHPDTESKHSQVFDGVRIYSEERRQLHDQIIEDFLRAGEQTDQPRALFMAGGSGAGKSSVMRTLDESMVPRSAIHVDADAIKERLPEFERLAASKNRYSAKAVHEQSSFLAKRLTLEASQRGYSVIIDGVGGGPTGKFAGKLRELKELGYEVDVVYVDVPTNTAVERAIKRAERSGRFVPLGVVRQLHQESAARFLEWREEQFIARWIAYDNTDTPEVFAAGGRGRVVVNNPKADARVRAKARTIHPPADRG